MKKLLPLLTFLISFQLLAQEDAWLYLKDKPSSGTFLASPLTMLSQRALDRRAAQSIDLDSKDVPVEVSYYSQIKNATGITVLAKSKWLNAIHVQGSETDIKNLKTTFSFVHNIEFANKSLNAKGKFSQKSSQRKKKNKFAKTNTTFNYGDASNQIEMLKGDYLHEQDFTGKNAQIAIIDAGFPNVNTLAAFKRLRDNNQILGGYDFVERDEDFYTGHNHGTHVLSTIGGYIENEFVGTAPDASFYLFRTEDAANEVPLEESLWVEAAERADSLGVDVINTSLGYSTFDDSKYDYSYADMDGKTTFITRGAEIGATKGMLIVVSAGNEGNNPWHYISAPADAPSVITVGAVNNVGNIAAFSSFGPTSDNRVKPEIVAKGQSASIIHYNSGLTSTSNGTSFSAPIIAGLIACLNENKGFTLKSTNQSSKNLNEYLKQAVYKSADKYNNPTDQYGYGLPNFEVALANYVSSLSVDENVLQKVAIYPNPISNTFTLDVNNVDLSGLNIQIFNVIGEKVFEKRNLKNKTIDVSILNSGIYILKLMSGTHHKTIKLIKK